jgi:hypothetical protein
MNTPPETGSVFAIWNHLYIQCHSNSNELKSYSASNKSRHFNFPFILQNEEKIGNAVP